MSLFFVFIPKFRWDDIAKKRLWKVGGSGKRYQGGLAIYGRLSIVSQVFQKVVLQNNMKY